MTERDLAFLSIAEATRLIRSRQISPVDLAKACLARMGRLDGALGSLITATPELALEQAREAERDVSRGRATSALHGIPITYKDIVATKGVRTTAASRVLRDWVPDTDAAIVQRLRARGAVMLGKAALSEFTFAGGSSANDFVKAPRNPWNTAHEAGGSSNGSAVGVAAGLALASVGSDSGGSIRIPAAFCGTTGLKPTYGRISRAGVIPLSYSLDHLGPITRSAEDAALMLDAMSGPDPADPTTLFAPVQTTSFASAVKGRIAGLRVGLLPDYVEAVGIDEATKRACDAAVATLRAQGMEIREVRVPHLAYASAAGYNTIMRVEAFRHHFQRMRDHRDAYGAAYRNIARGGFITAQDYLRAQQARTLIANEVRALFEEVDVLALPVTATTPGGGAYAHEGSDPKVRRGSFSHGAAYTSPFNLTGHPAVSIPCGFNPAGVPIGLQLVARPYREDTLLRVAHRFQLTTDFHRKRPAEPPVQSGSADPLPR